MDFVAIMIIILYIVDGLMWRMMSTDSNQDVSMQIFLVIKYLFYKKISLNILKSWNKCAKFLSYPVLCSKLQWRLNWNFYHCWICHTDLYLEWPSFKCRRCWYECRYTNVPKYISILWYRFVSKSLFLKRNVPLRMLHLYIRMGRTWLQHWSTIIIPLLVRNMYRNGENRV